MVFSNSIKLTLVVVVMLCGGTHSETDFQCPTTCNMDVVETIPDGMTVDQSHISTFDSWKQLIDGAKTSIEIASYYWTLQPYEYNHTTAKQGQEIYDSLLAAGTKRNVTIRIVKDVDSANFPNQDTKDLVAANAAEVRDVNFKSLIEAGVLHTKMVIVDREHVYLGSSNFDWRALTQVKEIGITGWNCSCLGQDFGKTFDVYWELGSWNNGTIPEGHQWPANYSSPFNKDVQMDVTYNGIQYSSYISSAPPQFCPENRTNDIDAIYDVMDKAEEFVHIAVMDYFPLIMFDGPLQYWPDLDNKLRSLAFFQPQNKTGKVKVKLLMANWQNTRASAKNFLQSLTSINGAYEGVDIQVKMYVVPADEDQKKIPFSRVNHNKYVVTDKSAYFGTSNWSGDYFISSGGIGIVITPKVNGTNNDIRTQLASIFERDWNSPNAKTLTEIYGPPSSSTTIVYANLKSIAVVLSLYFLLF